MFDDGTQGDAVNGDGIYTKQIVLNEIGPAIVMLRVSADVAPLQTSLSPTIQIPVSVVQAPDDARADLAANLRSGKLAEAYSKLGSSFNSLKILDNLPVDVLSSLADAVSTCNVVEQYDLLQICVGSIVINGQLQQLRFFLVKDALGLWRIIGW
jgi:hypothetical protein